MVRVKRSAAAAASLHARVFRFSQIAEISSFRRKPESSVSCCKEVLGSRFRGNDGVSFLKLKDPALHANPFHTRGATRRRLTNRLFCMAHEGRMPFGVVKTFRRICDLPARLAVASDYAGARRLVRRARNRVAAMVRAVERAVAGSPQPAVIYRRDKFRFAAPGARLHVRNPGPARLCPNRRRPPPRRGAFAQTPRPPRPVPTWHHTQALLVPPRAPRPLPGAQRHPRPPFTPLAKGPLPNLQTQLPRPTPLLNGADRYRRHQKIALSPCGRGLGGGYRPDRNSRETGKGRHARPLASWAAICNGGGGGESNSPSRNSPDRICYKLVRRFNLAAMVSRRRDPASASR